MSETKRLPQEQTMYRQDAKQLKDTQAFLKEQGYELVPYEEIEHFTGRERDMLVELADCEFLSSGVNWEPVQKGFWSQPTPDCFILRRKLRTSISTVSPKSIFLTAAKVIGTGLLARSVVRAVLPPGGTGLAKKKGI